MFGAILGDIIGSPYELDCDNIKTKDFSLFSRVRHFADDTVMTLAVAKAFMDTEAMRVAELAHRGQKRKSTDVDYIIHPIRKRAQDTLEPLHLEHPPI